MSRRFRDYVTLFVWAAILVATLAAPSAMAQELRGQIVGVATDSSGATLPGVLVTVTGPGLIRPQTATTDTDGSYRFPVLPPGDYVVTIELSQFQTVRREGIQLTLRRVLKIDATLGLASVSERVHVVATAPVVDVKSTALGTSFSKELLTGIPNARDLWSTMALAPGFSMSGVDVGGSHTGSQTRFVSYGVLGGSRTLVEGIRFARVGRRGEIQGPAGAARVDLSGKTVIPALVDGHSHIGSMRNMTSGAQNCTCDNILDHMSRFAYFGVAASQSMGTDFGEMPFLLRDEILAGKHPDAARFLTAGRGLSPLEEISPDNMRHAAFPITTVAGARAAVQELVPRHTILIKTWVDDRGGTVKSMAPELYNAIIDEAHRHNLRVAVHATGLQDAKALLRANVDVFAHMISDVDDELVALFKQHPNTVVLSVLGGPHRAVYAPWLHPVHPLIAETVRPEQVARLQSRFPQTNAQQCARSQEAWDRLARGIARLHAAGVVIGVGTDGGGQQGDQFIGWTMHAELENMVMAGIPPAQVLMAATRTTARILGQDDLGTVAAGKSADFIVLDANPLDEITNTRKISQVYLRGVPIDRAKLRAGFMNPAAPN